MRTEFFPYPFLLGLVLLLPLLLIARLRIRQPLRLACVGIFWLYLLLLVGVTLFPMPIPAGLGGTMPRQPLPVILERVNLIPFRYAVPPISAAGVSFELIGNVILTIPFGLLLPALIFFPFRHAPWLAFALGLGIESVQLLVSIAVGFGYRGVDITDVLLNAAGFILGYTFYRLFTWLAAVIFGLPYKYPRGVQQHSEKPR